MILKCRSDSIGLISLTGNITEKLAINFLLKLRSLPNYKPSISALILRVSSNGGSLGAAQTIADGLDFLRAELNIPVVSLVTDTALSAAYYVVISTDKCIATPASTLGNVGCVIRKLSLSSLLESIGIKYESVASGKNKDILFNLSSFNEDQKNILKELSKDLSNQFLYHILEKRKISKKALQYIEDGKIFSGRNAYELGLVDSNGSLFNAIQYCGEIIGSVNPSLVILDSIEKRCAPSFIQYLTAGFQELFSK